MKWRAVSPEGCAVNGGWLSSSSNCSCLCDASTLHFSQMNDLAISVCCGLGHAQVAVGGASALLLELSLAPPWAQPPHRLSAACGSCQAVFGDGTAWLL